MFKRLTIIKAVIFSAFLLIVLLAVWQSKQNVEALNPSVNAPDDSQVIDETETPYAPDVNGGEQVDISSTIRNEPVDQLAAFIPVWIREDGEFHRERIEVGGQWVERARGRYTWENGSEVEIEVSDLGENATAEQLKSLGFNLQMEINEESRTLRKRLDDDNYLANLEYDDESREGMLQYAVKNRYLLEIKLQNLPLESFQILEERNGTLQGLLDIRE